MNDVFKKAAKSALSEWYSGQWQLQEQELENLTNDLWVWFLERPSAQKKMDESEPKLQRALARRYALQRLAEATLSSDTFQGKNLFSVDSIKDALKGRSRNKYLKAVLPFARQAVQHADDRSTGRTYAEAIRSRYEDGKVPPRGSEQVNLVRALQALTDEVNVSYITNDVEGIGSDKVIFPGLRKRNGEHGDPTANIALTLMDNPEIQESYLSPTPWQQVTTGAASEPTYDLGRARIRPEAGSYPNWMLMEHPELEEIYVKSKREELGW